jgi:hypothetical protein
MADPKQLDWDLRNWSARSALSTWNHQSKCVKTDTSSVTAVDRRFRNVRLVQERLLKPEILLWKGLLLPPYIRARTGKLAVEKPSL